MRLIFDFNEDKVVADGLTADELLAPMRAYGKEHGIRETSYGVFEREGREAMAIVLKFVVRYSTKNPWYLDYLEHWTFNIDGRIEDCKEETLRPLI